MGKKSAAGSSPKGQSSQNQPTNKKSTKEVSIITKIYLIIYNFGQVLGWSFLLYQLVAYYTFDRNTTQTLWEYLGWTVIIFQNSALLEIIHAATGIVPSNVIITTFQVLSRVMVVCGVLLATPIAIYSPGLPLALLAWSITEIIRYGYYGLNILNAVPNILIWLRYTTFIILYPIGVTGELLCFYWAQGYARDTSIWSIEFPNKFNFTFSYYYFLWIVMLMYIPIFPHLYMHMFAQRKKILGKNSSNSSSSSSSDGGKVKGLETTEKYVKTDDL